MKRVLKRATWCVSALLMAGCFLNCSSDDDASPDPQQEEPKLSGVMVFSGQAEGKSEEINVLCQCDMRLEILEVSFNEDGSQVFEANLGGDISRTVLDDSGNGFSFAPFLFGEAVVTVEKDNMVAISWPANIGTGIRFYDEIALFEGVLNEDGSVSGSWNCAPLDLDQGGYVDLKGTVAGNWGLTREE
jgi:hypothetical protein